LTSIEFYHSHIDFLTDPENIADIFGEVFSDLGNVKQTSKAAFQFYERAEVCDLTHDALDWLSGSSVSCHFMPSVRLMFAKTQHNHLLIFRNRHHYNVDFVSDSDGMVRRMLHQRIQITNDPFDAFVNSYENTRQGYILYGPDSPNPVSERPSAFHLRAQRTAFRRRDARLQSRLSARHSRPDGKE